MPVWSATTDSVDISSSFLESVAGEGSFWQDFASDNASASSLDVEDDNNNGKNYLLTKWMPEDSNATPSGSFYLPVPVIFGMIVSAIFLLYLICVFANPNYKLDSTGIYLQQKHTRGNVRQSNDSPRPIVISTISTSYNITAIPGDIPTFFGAGLQKELSVSERNSEPPPSYEECVLQMAPNHHS